MEVEKFSGRSVNLLSVLCRWFPRAQAGGAARTAALARSCSPVAAHALRLCRVRDPDAGQPAGLARGRAWHGRGAEGHDALVRSLPGRVHPIAAGKWQRRRSPLTLLLRRERLRAGIGTPGGRRILTAIAQVLV